MSTPSPTPSSKPATPPPAGAPARKPLPWRVPSPKKDVAGTPSCNPNYRPPAPGK